MVVRVLVGVVEGNRFAENAREWSPRGVKIKTVFKFRSTGIFGARHGRTVSVVLLYLLVRSSVFFVSTPQTTLNKIPYILIPHSGGLGEAHYCVFVPADFFLIFFDKSYHISDLS